MSAELRSQAAVPVPAPRASARRAAHFFFAVERLRRLAGKVGKYGYAAYAGVLFGVLDREQLNAITDLCYAGMNPKWGQPAYNRSGLQAWETLLVDEFFRDCRSLLVGSAGGGRELLALSRAGFKVSAFDCSPKLLEVARALLDESGLDAEIVQVAPDEVPRLGTFDGAIIGWCGYMHVMSRQARIAFLRGVRAQLPAGAPFLVSFLPRYPENRELAVVAGVGNALRRLLRRSEPVEMGDEIKDLHTRHRFTAAEIEVELDAGGFHLERLARNQEYAVARAVEVPARL
jgi:2-polyprenyl-3-methyl-5-hydroxy-6-metoxy-1,4-benzoquinol methylase